MSKCPNVGAYGSLMQNMSISAKTWIFETLPVTYPSIVVNVSPCYLLESSCFHLPRWTWAAASPSGSAWKLAMARSLLPWLRPGSPFFCHMYVGRLVGLGSDGAVFKTLTNREQRQLPSDLPTFAPSSALSQVPPLGNARRCLACCRKFPQPKEHCNHVQPQSSFL